MSELEQSLYFFSLSESERSRLAKLKGAIKYKTVSREQLLQELADITLLIGNEHTSPRYPIAFSSITQRLSTLELEPSQTDKYLANYQKYLWKALKPNAEELIENTPKNL